MFLTPEPHGLGPSVALKLTVKGALFQPLPLAAVESDAAVTGASLSGSYVNVAVDELVPTGVVTVTLTAPAACGGAVAVSCSGVETEEVAVTEPNLTVAPSWKSVPEIVTLGAQ